MKTAHLKKLHTTEFQLYVLEKSILWGQKKNHWFPGTQREEGCLGGTQGIFQVVEIVL